MKNKIYPIIFVVFLVILFFLLRKDIFLEHEWENILQNFSQHDGYKYYGIPTAFMPPLYPYFLLFFKTFFGFTSWIKVSCFVQAIILFCSLYYLFKVFFGSKMFEIRIIIAFCIVLFFPPIFVGNIRVSSFALSLSIITLFFALLYKIFNSPAIKEIDLLFLGIICCAGLYVRYEFVFFVFLAALIFVILKKIKIFACVYILIFVFIAYVPWCIRNYEQIGAFKYATSLNYNFAKGNSINYDVFSSYNFPYDPATKEVLTNDILYKRFGSEKDIDTYLEKLNHDFIEAHPKLLFQLGYKKILVNFFQYFPDYNGLNTHKFYLAYSFFLTAFQVVLFLAIIRLYRLTSRNYLFYFTTGFYLFFLFFYSIAPIPRYFLFLFPVFTVIIAKVFTAENKESLLC